MASAAIHIVSRVSVETQDLTLKQAALAGKTVRNLEQDQSHMGTPSGVWVEEEEKDEKRRGTSLDHS